jgi:pimeloyl-ACP methyl ester carboxylesterase
MSCVVLLRGLTRESRHWGGFPELLRARLPGCDVIALDLPGNGALYTVESPCSVEAMAKACRDELLRRGRTPPYGVLAMSLGAMVALSWAADHPQELQGCVLINTSLRTFSPWHQRLRPGNYGRLLSLLWSSSACASERAVLELTTHHPPEPVADLLAEWAAWRRDAPVSRANALRQLWAAARFSPPRDKPRVPLLLLASDADTLVDPRCSTRIAQAWGAELHTHPTAGHDLPLDDSEWVVGEASRWLAIQALR